MIRHNYIRANITLKNITEEAKTVNYPLAMMLTFYLCTCPDYTKSASIQTHTTRDTVIIDLSSSEIKEEGDYNFIRTLINVYKNTV